MVAGRCAGPRARLASSARNAAGPDRNLVWNPTRFHIRPPRSSILSCTTAYGRRPVRGSSSPTGFIRPERSGSRSEPRLEPDEGPHPAPAVLHPELHHRVWSPAGARVLEPDWLHRTETQRV